MNENSINGVLALVPTVFDEKGDLDIKGFKENIRYLESVGMHGIVATSSVGEFYALDNEEFKKVASAARDACDKMTCVINCSYQNTRETIARTKYAEDIGADCAMIYIYHYMLANLSPDQYFEHFRLINDATHKIRLMIYNNPRETKGLAVSVDLYARLLESLDRMVACTEDLTNASEPMVRPLSELLSRFGQKISILSVDEAGMFLLMSLGGKGCLATYGLAMPKFLLKLHDKCKDGDWEAALKDYQTLTRYPCESGQVGINIKGKASLLFPGTVTTLIGNTHSILGRKAGTIFPGTVTICKAMAEAAGRKVGNPRLPLLPPTEGMKEFARKWLADIGELEYK